MKISVRAFAWHDGKWKFVYTTLKSAIYYTCLCENYVNFEEKKNGKGSTWF